MEKLKEIKVVDLLKIGGVVLAIVASFLTLQFEVNSIKNDMRELKEIKIEKELGIIKADLDYIKSDISILIKELTRR
ncbi:MAG: hypothetical protein FWE47_00085 [Oscillospiraceae bacterium]|nr:hypothetical protein [Oscillospiraceae bacterium]